MMLNQVVLVGRLVDTIFKSVFVLDCGEKDQENEIAVHLKEEEYNKIKDHIRLGMVVGIKGTFINERIEATKVAIISMGEEK